MYLLSAHRMAVQWKHKAGRQLYTKQTNPTLSHFSPFHFHSTLSLSPHSVTNYINYIHPPSLSWSMPMASACVSNNLAMSPDTFAWLSPRRLSQDPDPSSSDFEFRLQDPVTNMLPADQLFSNGKLLPLHLSNPPPPESPAAAAPPPHLFSPKAPKCSSRWKELLGFRKLCQSSSSSSNAVKNNDAQKTTSSCKSLKLLLLHNRTSKSSSDASSLGLFPLLKDSDSESISISSSSRLSLSSSSSSGHEHEDLPRLSLDSSSDKPNPNTNPISLLRNPNSTRPRMRLVKSSTRTGSYSFDANNPPGYRVGRSPIRGGPGEGRGVSVDSPRMNSCGKIVFESLERSSSSPSSFKHRGSIERSYSANVRVTPVLNVPVCSLRGSTKSGSVFGFGQLFSSPGGSRNAKSYSRHRTL